MYGTSVFYFHFITRPSFEKRNRCFLSLCRLLSAFNSFFFFFFFAFAGYIFPPTSDFLTEATIFFVSSFEIVISSGNLIRFSVVRIACFKWNTFVVLKACLMAPKNNTVHTVVLMFLDCRGQV